VRRKDFSSVECSIARAADEVGDPWSLLVLRHAFLGVRRFADLQAALDIPPNTLTNRLTALQKKGLLKKRKYESHPPRYEYDLTERSLDLLPLIVSLAVWGSRWKAPGGPPFELVDAESGELLDPVFVDRRTGKLIEPGNIGLRIGPGASSELRRAVATAGRDILVLGKTAAASQGACS
jgi:DNA-binding HxlR family transcriptional regulator